MSAPSQDGEKVAALTPAIREELAQYARESSPHSPFVKLWFAFLELEARR